ncbi:Protein T05H4.10 [Aphelenchoides avenae]|nr:Protein T05H4.10 [Aphelenchus avenae]
MTKSELSSKRRRGMYDPRFVLQTLYHLVGAGSELTCVKFITSNALSFTFASTSFQSPDLRALAYLTLARFGKLLGDLSAEKFEARSLYVMLITKLRNSIEDLNPRICHPVSHFFARVSKLMLHPEDPVYAPIMAFLTMTPTINLEAVPEFYKLFYSSSTQFYQNERRWMLKLCAEALLDSYDYSVMSKNYIIEAALALFTSPMADQVSKSLILRLLENCFAILSVAHELQRRCNVATWIPQAMQCVGITRQEQFVLCRLFVTLCRCASTRNEPERAGGWESEPSFFLLQLNARQILTVVDNSDDYVKQQMHDVVQRITEGNEPAKEESFD